MLTPWGRVRSMVEQVGFRWNDSLSEGAVVSFRLIISREGWEGTWWVQGRMLGI